jgi:hypothetical protein
LTRHVGDDRNRSPFSSRGNELNETIQNTSNYRNGVVRIDLAFLQRRHHSPAIKMARTASPENALRGLIDEFVSRLVSVVEADVSTRTRQMVMAALDSGAAPRRRGRPPKFPKFSVGSLLAAGTARRRPKQLCPVPGCTNPAAPVFGMVCKDHKDVAKSQIKKYREARRADKDKTKAKA